MMCGRANDAHTAHATVAADGVAFFIANGAVKYARSYAMGGLGRWRSVSDVHSATWWVRDARGDA